MTEAPFASRDPRTMGYEELLRAIPEAGAAWLAAALDSPELTEEHVARIVRNRSTSAATLTRIGSTARWVKSYEIKSGIVSHPRTPRHLAMNFLRHLFWRDLAHVAGDPFLAPPLRRAAERILSERITDLTIGERTTLARIAGRGMIRRLLEEPDRSVLDALLWNQRVTEQDLLATVALMKAPPDLAAIAASHPRWKGHYALRLAIARSPRTPIAVSLGLLTSLRARDLADIAEAPGSPTLLRQACERILEDPEWRRRKSAEEEA